MGLFQKVLIFLCVAYNVALGAKRLRVIPDNIDLWTDNDILNVTYAIEPKTPYLNITWNVLKKIDDLECHVESTMRTKGDLQHFAVLNTTFSICHLLALKSVHPVVMLAFAHAKRQGMIPESCPIPKGVYSLRKIWPPEDNFPQNLPIMEMQAKMEFRAVNNGVSTLIGTATLSMHSEYKEGSNLNIKIPFMLG